jgi:plastocyanin
MASNSAPIVDRLRIIPRPDDFLDRNVGSSGEVFFNKVTNSLRVYSGKDVAGFEIARADLNNISNSDFSAKATAAGISGATPNWADITNKPSFATVATSGLYTDLSNTPTIPSDISDLTDNSNLLAEGSGVSADPEYNNGAIIDLTGDGSNFFSREVTTNGVRIVAAGAVGGQTAVPDAFVEKVARMFELFTDVNGAGINEASQRTFIKTLSGDAGTYHAAVGPTLQRVARGAGSDYTPNFLTDSGIASYNLSPLFDSHVANDMVWYLNSTGAAPGDGDNDAQEVIEHVFHTLHMHGLDAVSLKMYSYITADWASGPLYAAMEEAYDAGKWDSSGYGGNAWKTDGDAFEVAAKEYLFLLNFGMFEYSSLWDGGSLSPEWTDDMRTQSGIQANNPLGYALHNTYIAPVISKPSLTTIRSIFQDGDVGDPTVAGASGYVVDVVSGVGENLVVSEFSFAIAADDSTQRLISNGETVQIIGGTGITTASDAEGNITITAAAASTTFATLTDASTASLTIDKIYEPAIAMLRVDNIGTSAYTINSHYSGNNPNIYVISGTTIAFDLDAIAGHPFELQDNTLTALTSNLVHVTSNGTVSTNSAAQGKSSGTLYWRIPESVTGTYVYQCQSHASMFGSITIKDLSNL